MGTGAAAGPLPHLRPRKKKPRPRPSLKRRVRLLEEEAASSSAAAASGDEAGSSGGCGSTSSALQAPAPLSASRLTREIVRLGQLGALASARQGPRQKEVNVISCHPEATLL